MQAGRARTVVASAAALVLLAGAGAGCSSGGSSSTTSADPCEQVVNDAVAAWNGYTSKHGPDVQNPPPDATDDLKALTDEVQRLETEMTNNNCNPDQVGNSIKEKAPDFLGNNRQSSTTPPTTAP